MILNGTLPLFVSLIYFRCWQFYSCATRCTLPGYCLCSWKWSWRPQHLLQQGNCVRPHMEPEIKFLLCVMLTPIIGPKYNNNVSPKYLYIFFPPGLVWLKYLKYKKMLLIWLELWLHLPYSDPDFEVQARKTQTLNCPSKSLRNIQSSRYTFSSAFPVATSVKSFTGSSNSQFKKQKKMNCFRTGEERPIDCKESWTEQSLLPWVPNRKCPLAPSP